MYKIVLWSVSPLIILNHHLYVKHHPSPPPQSPHSCFLTHACEALTLTVRFMSSLTSNFFHLFYLLCSWNWSKVTSNISSYLSKLTLQKGHESRLCFAIKTVVHLTFKMVTHQTVLQEHQTVFCRRGFNVSVTPHTKISFPCQKPQAMAAPFPGWSVSLVRNCFIFRGWITFSLAVFSLKASVTWTHQALQ